jgi:hypothetical protein
MEGGRVTMAQHGAGTACQDCRHPPPTDGQLSPPDGVDATVDDVEAARFDAPPDLMARVPHSPKLPVRDDAVLPIRERRDPLIT